jgi:uncharacterized protein YaiI (UPF0178 family)
MHIWVDADACPGPIKEILFRAAQRTGLRLTLVANQPINIPRAANINAVQVASGFDVADNEIVRRSDAGDLVVTGARLNMRDFMDTLRASGVNTGGPPALSQGDRQAFANQLDKLITARLKQDLE